MSIKLRAEKSLKNASHEILETNTSYANEVIGEVRLDGFVPGKVVWRIQIFDGYYLSNETLATLNKLVDALPIPDVREDVVANGSIVLVKESDTNLVIRDAETAESITTLYRDKKTAPWTCKGMRAQQLIDLGNALITGFPTVKKTKIAHAKKVIEGQTYFGRIFGRGRYVEMVTKDYVYYLCQGGKSGTLRMTLSDFRKIHNEPAGCETKAKVVPTPRDRKALKRAAQNNIRRVGRTKSIRNPEAASRVRYTRLSETAITEQKDDNLSAL